MPEIPEITAHAERMAAAISGSRITDTKLLKFTTLKTYSPTLEELHGRIVLGVQSRGKFILIELDKQLWVAIHLMSGGRFSRQRGTNTSSMVRNGLLSFMFASDKGLETLQQLWMLTEAGSERKAGVWLLHTPQPSEELPLKKIGPDVTTATMDTLRTRLSSQSGRIHNVLRDQTAVAGIGRMLANEICHEAKLSPFANPKHMTERQLTAVCRSIKEVVATALEHERGLDDIGKAADRPSRVHNRVGQPCLACSSGTIASVEYSFYTIAYCPACQTDGKILADNITSRFLK